jgi:hypothetical protein
VRARTRSKTSKLKVKTVIRKRSNRWGFLNPALAVYRQGAVSEPPTGAIVRQSARRSIEADWIEDTQAE